jgi:hypothetical protein
MTVLIDVQPMELLEILIDKERQRQRLAVLEAERRKREPETGAGDP